MTSCSSIVTFIASWSFGFVITFIAGWAVGFGRGLRHRRWTQCD
jgi:hypothetical protein